MSLGIIDDEDWNPLNYLVGTHTVIIPRIIVSELEETAAYDDASGQGAQRTLDHQDKLEVAEVNLDDSFPLDDGENAAVTLANELNATQFLCDEFNRLALIHASLVDTDANVTRCPQSKWRHLVNNGRITTHENERCTKLVEQYLCPTCTGCPPETIVISRSERTF